MRTECDLAQDQRRDQRYRVGLKQVRCHAGAVADVVADVVGDGRSVAWVVFRDPLLHLADQVGADVGRLGKDAAADPHEHGEQGGAEAEALEHTGCVRAVQDHDNGGPEQTQTNGEHAGHAAGAERDPHRRALARLLGRGSHPDVATHGQPHASKPGSSGEQRPDEEEDGPAEAYGLVDGRQHEQHEEDQHDEDAQRLELPPQVSRRAFLDRLGDLLHLRRALTGRQHVPDQPARDGKRHQRDDGHHGYPGEIAPGYCGASSQGEGVRHPSSLTGDYKLVPSRCALHCPAA